MEYEHRKERDAHAWNDDINSIEKRLSPQFQVENYVGVGFFTARVILFIAHRRDCHDVPFGGQIIFLQIHAHFNAVVAAPLIDVAQVHHVPVVGPAAEFHEALLLIKGEELHIDFA